MSSLLGSNQFFFGFVGHMSESPGEPWSEPLGPLGPFDLEAADRGEEPVAWGFFLDSPDALDRSEAPWGSGSPLDIHASHWPLVADDAIDEFWEGTSVSFSPVGRDRDARLRLELDCVPKPKQCGPCDRPPVSRNDMRRHVFEMTIIVRSDRPRKEARSVRVLPPNLDARDSIVHPCGVFGGINPSNATQMLADLLSRHCPMAGYFTIRGKKCWVTLVFLFCYPDGRLGIIIMDENGGLHLASQFLNNLSHLMNALYAKTDPNKSLKHQLQTCQGKDDKEKDDEEMDDEEKDDKVKDKKEKAKHNPQVAKIPLKLPLIFFVCAAWGR